MSKTLETALALPPINTKTALTILTRTLQNEVTKTGISKVVIGVSGGIDSALTLYLAARVFPKENIHAIFMPYQSSSPSSRDHAHEATDKLGVKLDTVEITNMADPYFATFPPEERLRRGNILARLRMIVLYDQSAARRALVLGTSNKTEMLLGYSTLWGDMASAVNPLGDLYKFQVRALSRELGVPDNIIDKPPSADLWEGQNDEDEMDITYNLADRILYHWIDKAWPKTRITAALKASGENPENADLVFQKVQRSQFKRKMPIIVKLSETTVDREFRYPRDWGL
ncbi:MAG: NAD+ synthase [Leptospirales bacterium]